MKKLLSLLLLVLMLLSASACGGSTHSGTPGTAPLTEAPAAPEVTEAPAATEAPVTTQAPVTTKAAEQIPDAQYEPKYEAGDVITVQTVWNFGYVASASHGTRPNQLVANGGSYSYTDVIELPLAGTRISFTDDNTNSNGDTGYASTNAYVISFWKKKGNSWLLDTAAHNYAGAAGGNTEVAKNNGSSLTYSYVSTVDGECVRLCYRSGQTASFTPKVFPKITMQLTGETGTNAAAGQSAAEFEKYIEGLKSAAARTSLKGLTLYAIGDSYFAGNGLNKDYVWPALLAAEYGMKFTNYGINGSTVSDYSTEHNPMVRRYKDMAAAQPDIILFEGGKNDFNVNAPIGTDTDTSTTTFKGALNTVLDGLQAKYPNAFILCVTPWRVSGFNSIVLDVQAYAKAMREVCALRGIPCFNASDPSVSSVDMTDASFRAKYCMAANDVSHLNLEGHKRVLPKFEAFIADEYEKFIKAKQ